MHTLAAFDQTALPAGLRSRFVEDVNGLRMHILEAGFQSGAAAGDRPCPSTPQRMPRTGKPRRALPTPA